MFFKPFEAPVLPKILQKSQAICPWSNLCAWVSNAIPLTLDIRKPMKNIALRREGTLDGQGSVTIGSETSAVINNIYIHDCHFGNRLVGINIKTMKGRGGYIKNIDFENITLKNARREAIRITFRYDGEPLDDQSAPITDVPDLHSISVKGFRCDNAPNALRIDCLPGFPIRDIHLSGIEISAENAGLIQDVTELYVENVFINKV